MNSCGLNIPDILSDFVGDISAHKLKELLAMFNFDRWYPLVKDQIKTPTSYIFQMEDLHNGNIDKLLETLPTNECFARLDSCSTKPEKAYKSSLEIVNDIYKNSRTFNEIENSTKIIIREWVYGITNEFRCYVHDSKLRGISCEKSTHRRRITENIVIINQNVNKITKITEFDDYTVDFGFDSPDNLIMIEINSPVYLAATSGNFDLIIPGDYEILLGDYIPDIINYPIIKCNETADVVDDNEG
jgi:hypothetical protein